MGWGRFQHILVPAQKLVGRGVGAALEGRGNLRIFPIYPPETGGGRQIKRTGDAISIYLAP